MSINLELLHMLLIQNAEIGMPIRDLAFAVGARKSETEVVLAQEHGRGHIKEETIDGVVRYFTLKRHFSKSTSLRIADERVIALHQVLQNSKSGLLLSEIQEKTGMSDIDLEKILFDEKTVERIVFVSEESRAYRSTLEFPVENLVLRSTAVQLHKKRSRLPEVGLIAGIAVGALYYILMFL